MARAAGQCQPRPVRGSSPSERTRRVGISLEQRLLDMVKERKKKEDLQENTISSSLLCWKRQKHASVLTREEL